MNLTGAAWAASVAVPAALDVWLIRTGRQSMSSALGDFLHPETARGLRRWRYVVVVGWGVLTIHLFSCLFPPRWRQVASRVDPLGVTARVLTPTTKEP